MEQFIAAGVDQETAEQDACRIEHAISDTSFRKLKEKVQGYYLGMTVNEIAGVEGVDPSRVRDSIRRGLKQLGKYF